MRLESAAANHFESTIQMWDEPSAEVTQMKKECESILENSEEHIEDWYFNHQETDIQGVLLIIAVLQ